MLFTQMPPAKTTASKGGKANRPSNGQETGQGKRETIAANPPKSPKKRLPKSDSSKARAKSAKAKIEPAPTPQRSLSFDSQSEKCRRSCSARRAPSQSLTSRVRPIRPSDDQSRRGWARRNNVGVETKLRLTSTFASTSHCLTDLMTCVGELGVSTQSGFASSTHANTDRRVSSHFPSGSTDHCAVAQESVMKTRMQPIGNVWSKFPRLRSRSSGNLLTSKVPHRRWRERKRLDKTIIEAISKIHSRTWFAIRWTMGSNAPSTAENHGKPEGRLF